MGLEKGCNNKLVGDSKECGEGKGYLKDGSLERGTQDQGEFLNSVFESLPYPFYVIDAGDYTILKANSAATIDGIWIGSKCYEATHKREAPCHGQEHNCPLEEVKKTKKPSVVEHTHFNNMGETRTFEVHGYPIFDKHGVVTRMIEYSVDVTDRKKTEEKLKRSEEKFRNLYDQASDGIIVVDPTHENGPVIIDANKAAWQIHGYTKEEFIGLPISVLETEESQKDIGERAKHLLSGAPLNFETEHIRKDGSILPLEVHAKAIITDEKPLIFSIERDLTPRKKAEEELRRERDKMQEYLDLAGTFFVALNSKGEVTLINNKGCQVLGYAENEIVGKNWFENFIPEWLRKELIPVSNKLLKGEIETAEYYENPVLTRNGEERLIAWHNTIVKDDNGNIIGHLSSGEDITDKKKAEEKLKSSEATLKSIFKAAPVGIGMVIDRTFSFLNDNMCSMVGYSRDELLGKSSRIFYPSDEEFDRVGREKYKQIREKGLGTIETRFQHKDGNIINVLLSSSPIDQRDFSKGVTFTALDITQRKNAERKIRESEERYKELLESVTDYIYTVYIEDGTAVSTTHGPGALPVTGYAPEEFISSPLLWYELIFPEDREFVVKNAEDLISGIEIKPFEHRINHKDGSVRWVRNTPVKRYGPRGELIAYDGLISDITDRKNAEIELVRAYDELKSTEKLKTDILANVSHELKTPITIIQGSLELALEEEDPNEIISLIMRSQKALERQTATINDLVAIGEMELAKIYKKPENMETLVRSQIEPFYSKALERRIKIEIDFKKENPIVPVDRDKISHVIRNLMDNAIKFNKEGGKIIVNVETDDKFLKVSVSDNGIGIKEGDLDKVFLPLTQLDASTKRKYSGTGTGLAVGKRFVEIHGGRIWVESILDQGSTFYLTLPIGKQ